MGFQKLACGFGRKYVTNMLLCNHLCACVWEINMPAHIYKRVTHLLAWLLKENWHYSTKVANTHR